MIKQRIAGEGSPQHMDIRSTYCEGAATLAPPACRKKQKAKSKMQKAKSKKQKLQKLQKAESGKRKAESTKQNPLDQKFEFSLK
jgi:hypothetical protein